MQVLTSDHVRWLVQQRPGLIPFFVGKTLVKYENQSEQPSDFVLEHGRKHYLVEIRCGLGAVEAISALPRKVLDYIDEEHVASANVKGVLLIDRATYLIEQADIDTQASKHDIAVLDYEPTRLLSEGTKRAPKAPSDKQRSGTSDGQGVAVGLLLAIIVVSLIISRFVPAAWWDSLNEVDWSVLGETMAGLGLLALISALPWIGLVTTIAVGVYIGVRLALKHSKGKRE